MQKNNANSSKSRPARGRQGNNKRSVRGGGRAKSTLDPLLLIQEASLDQEPQFKHVVTREYADFSLQQSLKDNIQKMGFTQPTPIQDQTFESLVDGRDLIGIASTGTGKTGAFLIPLLERFLTKETATYETLVVVPTRELALQVADELRKLTVGLKVRSACFIGGTNVEKDVRTLKNKFDFIIGTPGRLLDLKNRGSLKFHTMDVLVLDEFDKMLDMGFVHDIQTIAKYMVSRTQTLLFSATRDKKQQQIINQLVESPLVVELSSGDTSSKNVNQDIIRVEQGQNKFDLLQNLIVDGGFDKVILFTETKHLAKRLSGQLNAAGIKSDEIHGNKSQNYRVNALKKFKTGAIRVLVATDVAARGIDVSDVSLVVNYELPTDFDTYIHRVGRTGRAGKTGTAYTFVD